ncbi:hypothetical protein [Streptomyces sp. NPDC056160]|uniref:hypothetical protein n=1 Tax=Streptomyces sp. NPDC056160 TaxID=3345731 RepID=UPI0035D7720E
MSEPRTALCRPLETDDFHRVPRPAVFKELAARGPVHRVVLPGEVSVWLITDRAAAEAALRDPRLTKDPLPVARYGQAVGSRRVPEDFTAVSGRQLMNLDGLDHTRIRRVMGKYLSETAMARRQAVIDEAIEDRLVALATRETADLIADFATPLALDVVGRMVGVPADLTKIIMLQGEKLLGPADPTDPDMVRAYHVVAEAVERAWQERTPEDGHGDLLEALLRAQQDGLLSRREIASNLAMVVIGGVVTIPLLGYGAAKLLEDSRARTELLTGDPGAVVEELLRSDPPISFTSWRFATEPMVVAGQAIEPGEAVMVLIVAANDDAACPAAARRGSRGPGHLSFGGGVHRCMGAHLARRTAATAWPALLRRFPGLRLELPVEELVWYGGFGPRGPERIPIRLTGPRS